LEDFYAKKLAEIAEGLNTDATFETETIADFVILLPPEAGEEFQRGWSEVGSKPIGECTVEDVDRRQSFYLNLASILRHDLLRIDDEIRATLGLRRSRAPRASPAPPSAGT
jgi:hypothetical protein